MGLYFFINKEILTGDDSREVLLLSSFWKRESSEGPI
jgi:hypothetical protein